MAPFFRVGLFLLFFVYLTLTDPLRIQTCALAHVCIVVRCGLPAAFMWLCNQ